MHLTFHPMRLDAPVRVVRDGDKLVLNDEIFDFTELPEGATLPAEAIESPWIAGDVTRENGELHIPLILPHGVNAPNETRYPTPITVKEDGPVTLAAYTLEDQ